MQTEVLSHCRACSILRGVLSSRVQTIAAAHTVLNTIFLSSPSSSQHFLTVVRMRLVGGAAFDVKWPWCADTFAHVHVALD